MIFNCITPSIVFQEVPNEISLCFSITGCKVACKGCHSTELWHEKNGIPLTNESFVLWLKKYQGLLSCVVFFGGEWQPNALIEKLLIAKEYGLKTCLYSGEKYIAINIYQQLNFLKTGAWVAALGGLENTATNQVFINTVTGEKLNHLFNDTFTTANPVNALNTPNTNTTNNTVNILATNTIDTDTSEPYQLTQHGRYNQSNHFSQHNQGANHATT